MNGGKHFALWGSGGKAGECNVVREEGKGKSRFGTVEDMSRQHTFIFINSRTGKRDVYRDFGCRGKGRCLKPLMA